MSKHDLMGLPKEIREQVGELEAEMAALAVEQEENRVRAKELIDKETKGEGIFAAEIHELKQGKMRIATEIQHRKVRINHLLLSTNREFL